MKEKKNLEILRELRESEVSKLVKNVIDIILDECDGKPGEYIKNVMEYSCVSGCVSALIHYKDTEKFFKDNCKEILKIFDDYVVESGDIPSFEINPNTLAWFGFENVAFDLVYKVDTGY